MEEQDYLDESYAAVKAALRKAGHRDTSLPEFLSDKKLRRLTEAVVKYCEVQSGIGLFWYQREFALRVVYSLLTEDGDEVTALFSRQSGKTEAVGVLVSGLVVILPLLARQVPDPRITKWKDGFWVGVFAPQYKTAHILTSRIRQRLLSDRAIEVILDEFGMDLEEKRKSRSMTLENGSKIAAISAKTNTTIEGETFHFIVIEECQAMDSRLIRKSIHPMGAATGATLVKIGTPSTEKSEFFEACRRNRNLSRSQSEFDRNHFQFDYLVAAKSNPRYARYIQKEMERLGFESDEFRMAYRLHWLMEQGMFMSEELFELCSVRRRTKMVRRTGAITRSAFVLPCHLTTYDDRRRCVAGIDFGKTASTVVTVMAVNYEMPVTVDNQVYYHKHIMNWLELKGDDHETQFPQIVSFLQSFTNLEIVVADATGVGDAIVSRLKVVLQHRRVKVVPFVFSPKSKDIGYRLWTQELTAGRFTWPASTKAAAHRKFQNFQSQMAALTKRYQGNRLIVEKPKEKMGRDDFPDSAMLANWAGTASSKVQEATQELRNPFFGRGQHHRNGLLSGRGTRYG